MEAANVTTVTVKPRRRQPRVATAMFCGSWRRLSAASATLLKAKIHQVRSCWPAGGASSLRCPCTGVLTCSHRVSILTWLRAVCFSLCCPLQLPCLHVTTSHRVHVYTSITGSAGRRWCLWCTLAVRRWRFAARQRWRPCSRHALRSRRGCAVCVLARVYNPCVAANPAHAAGRQ